MSHTETLSTILPGSEQHGHVFVQLSTLHAHLPPDGLHPAIGMCTHSPEGARVRLSLNASWENNDIIPMSIDSWDEEWVRQHGIRLNGQVSKGRGGLKGET